MHAYDEYWHYRTKAVVILHNAKITPELLNAIRSTDSRVQPEFSNGQLALEVLNRSIVAYAVETRQLFGLRVLSPLTTSQFHNQIIAGLLLVGYKGSQFAESDILELLSFGIDLPLDETHYEVWSGDIDDLPTIDQSRIQKLLSSHEENLHHELMFTAKNLMVQQQYATALVVAIAAVETVHGAFMRNALGRVLPNEEAERSRLINDFMREQGFYALVRMSPYLFLEQNERPLPEDVARCTRGIEIRNAIMHGLVRKGKFKMRQYSFEDYSDGYKGAIALYKAFSDALEKRREDG
ncbi:MAG: hypothetical protein JW719_00775 [Pirellulales bacterium]|nr:hypothetical protein [Pirellulales bacterium]